jgi:hypothetical protein
MTGHDETRPDEARLAKQKNRETTAAMAAEKDGDE